MVNMSKTNMIFHIGGKTYNSMEEYAEAEKHNPDSTNIIWEWQNIKVFTMVNGKPKYPEGAMGKCWYRGKSYEGSIKEIDGKLYVGGEFVKEL